MSSELRKIAGTFEHQYWAPDGLARLDVDDKHPPFKGVIPTVTNQNGAMFLIEIMIEFKRHGYDIEPWRDRVYKAFKYLQIPDTGVFQRRHGEEVFMDSHDNSLAIALGCVLFKFDDIMHDMFMWQALHGGGLNNLDPKNEFDVRAERQGSSTALYTIAAGGYPSMLNSIWLIGSALPFWGEIRKLRLRRDIVKLAYERYKSKRVFVISLALDVLWWIKGGFPKLAKESLTYYKPGNPYRQLLNLPIK